MQEKGKTAVPLNVFILIFLGVLLLAFALLFVFLILSLKNTRAKIDEVRQSQAENQALSLMQQQIGQLTQNLGQQLQNMSGQLQRTTLNLGDTLGNVNQNIGKMEAATREVLEKAKDISSLEELLRAPKFRGGMGELFLADLLAQTFPPSVYDLQHKFKSGEKVDAALRIGSNIVPIDSKFPLENFQRYIQEDKDRERETWRKKFVVDVKKHIDDIASKYILPDEGTYEFALMYIPAENVYYETILKDEHLGEERSLLSYAMKKRVMPVSPNSFFAYLQVIVLGLKGLQIEKSAQDIFKSLAQLQGDLVRFKSDFQVLGGHISNAKTKFDESERRLGKFTDRLDVLSGEQPAALPESTGDKEEST
jgi:DNA recombination protein RmuC